MAPACVSRATSVPLARTQPLLTRVLEGHLGPSEEPLWSWTVSHAQQVCELCIYGWYEILG